MAVLTTPLLNKGTAFTTEEREALGLTGLLPPVISSLEAQVNSAYTQYQRLPDPLSRNIYLTALHDRNEVLFFRVLSEHLREMIPIVNDRTVGLAMEQYHHECRRPRGVYLSIDHADAIEGAFGNLGAGENDIEQWYVERFQKLRETVFQNSSSYFHRYARLTPAESIEMARRLWTSINLVNLRENIVPTRERAHLILEKGRDHAVRRVRLRKL